MAAGRGIRPPQRPRSGGYQPPHPSPFPTDKPKRPKDLIRPSRATFPKGQRCQLKAIPFWLCSYICRSCDP